MPEPQRQRRKLPQSELDILARLREAREFLRLTQKEFAGQIGITRQRLASYEEGRVPLRWEIALRACRQFFISELWLATGILSPAGLERWGGIGDDGDARITMSLFTRPIVQRLRPGMLFSEAFDQHLHAEFERDWNDHVCYPPVVLFPGDDPQLLKNALAFYTQHLTLALHPDYLVRFFTGIIKAAIVLQNEILLEDCRRGHEAITFTVDLENLLEAKLRALVSEERRPLSVPPQAQEPSEKKELTASSLKGIVRGVKSPLKVLLDRVAQTTRAQRGNQAALAAFLKVSPARVSEWVRGVKEPGGDYALRLLEWVEAEEAQQKAPGGAEHAAKGKTRSIHSKDETKNSGPIKS